MEVYLQGNHLENQFPQLLTIESLGLVKVSERVASLQIMDSSEKHPWFQRLAP